MINRRFTKGLNLIELLLVLGIISILIIAAFFMFPNVRAEVNANKELKNVAAIQSNINGVPEYNYKQYWITYTGVPKEACQQFSLAMLNGSKALNVGGIQVRFHTDPTGGGSLMKREFKILVKVATLLLDLSPSLLNILNKKIFFVGDKQNMVYSIVIPSTTNEII